MKYVLSLIVLSVLAFGEYVYVQVMPFPAERRVKLLEETSIASEAVHSWKLYRIEESIDAGGPFGFSSLVEKGQLRGDDALVGHDRPKSGRGFGAASSGTENLAGERSQSCIVTNERPVNLQISHVIPAL